MTTPTTDQDERVGESSAMLIAEIERLHKARAAMEADRDLWKRRAEEAVETLRGPHAREAVRRALDKLTEPGIRTLDEMTDGIIAALLSSISPQGKELKDE